MIFLFFPYLPIHRFSNHEKSKKHKENVAFIKEQLAEEENLANPDEVEEEEDLLDGSIDGDLSEDGETDELLSSSKMEDGVEEGEDMLDRVNGEERVREDFGEADEEKADEEEEEERPVKTK